MNCKILMSFLCVLHLEIGQVTNLFLLLFKINQLALLFRDKTK